MIKILRTLFLAILFCTCIPFGFSQWQFIGSPECGVPLNYDAEGDTVYVCSRSGLFYSTDNATTWISISIPDSATFLKRMYVENSVLYLTASPEDYGYNPTRIYRSDDLGANWKDISLPSFQTYYSVLLLADTLFIGLNDSIAISYDHGDTYLERPFRHYDRIFIHRGMLMVVSDHVLYNSKDQGITWDSVLLDPVDFFLAEISSMDTLLWRSDVSEDYSEARIRKSYDNGKSWLYVLKPESVGEAGHFIVAGQGNFLCAAEQGTASRIYLSNDGGTHWVEKDKPSDSYSPFYTNGLLFFHSPHGILVSDDGGASFGVSNNGFTSADVERFAWFNDQVWVNANSAMFKKEKENTFWAPVTNIRNLECTVDGHLVARKDGAFQRSSDGGASWTTMQSNDFDPPTFTLGTFVGAGNMMYSISTYYRTYYSSDHGISWKLSEHTFFYIGYDQKYFGVTADKKVLLSTDGITWEDVTFNLSFFPHPHYFHLLHYHNGSLFVSLYGGENYRLSPGSTKWESFTHPVHPDPHFSNSVAIHTMKNYNDVLFAGVNGYGVYTSGDNGDSWQAANDGLTNKQIISSAIINDDIYVGAQGGVWKRPLSEFVTASVSEAKNNLSFSVSPNPVEDFLNITINNPDITNEIHLSLFDSKGKLVNSMLAPVKSNIKLNLRDIPPGIYYIKATGGNKTGAGKIIKL